MGKGQFDPRIHHRRSIRLKGHDYAGGGLYFVTICAHRDFIAFAKGNPFGAGPTQVSPVRELIEERMRITAKKFPCMKWKESVIMPDHVHALIRMQAGRQRLGDIIGGLKAAVTRELRRGDTCVVPGVHPDTSPPTNIHIWHRNYYEAIVRSPESEAKITEYIRMNPWRCVTELGNGLRGMGNPALWNREKLGVLCSRNAPAPGKIPGAGAYLGGFHSQPEKSIFERLLEGKRPLIWCPAWGLDRVAFLPGVRQALEENRMLVLEMRNRDGNLAAAEERNRFVIESADDLWVPHVTPGGMLARLLEEVRS